MGLGGRFTRARAGAGVTGLVGASVALMLWAVQEAEWVIADLGVVGWAEQQHDGALTLGLGEHGLSVIICEHGQQRPRHCLVKLDSRFGPSGLTPESYVLAVGLSFGRPECLINRVMRPSCRPAVRLPSRRARLSPARLNPGCARGC